jgi:hypothetical protein
MTSHSPTSIDNMHLRIPIHVQAALEAEFRLHVRAAYAKHLSDGLAACNAAVPQAALPLLPAFVPKITPHKADKPATETSGNIQGKRKASGTPPRSKRNRMNPVATFVAATFAAAASAAAAITAAIIAVTTTAAAGTSVENALEVLDSDSDNTDDTFPPPKFPKKEHGLTIILGMDIKNHLELIKLDISIVVVKTEPGTSNTRYVNGIHFLATVLAITKAPVAVKDLLPQMKNIGNRKDVRTNDIIGFLTTNGVELTPLATDYETIMKMDRTRPIIIKEAVSHPSFKSTDLPPSWLQFCLLLKKENYLFPSTRRARPSIWETNSMNKNGRKISPITVITI